jgi:hypothetical protein
LRTLARNSNLRALRIWRSAAEPAGIEPLPEVAGTCSHEKPRENQNRMKAEEISQANVANKYPDKYPTEKPNKKC